MKKLFAVLVLLVVCSVELSAGIHSEGYPRHDCWGGAGNHGWETWFGSQVAEGCINHQSANYHCDHQYGPVIWVAIGQVICDDGDSACGAIYCSGSTKNVSLGSCPGHVQADRSGLYCFTDMNSDHHFNQGDILLSSATCSTP